MPIFNIKLLAVFLLFSDGLYACPNAKYMELKNFNFGQNNFKEKFVI